MKPHNFENQVKEALGERQIEPRPESWDRLNAMLTANEAKPVRKFFPYWNIAAAVAVFIGLFSFYLFQSEPVVDVALPKNEVVSTESSVPKSVAKQTVETTEVLVNKENQSRSFNHQSNQINQSKSSNNTQLGIQTSNAVASLSVDTVSTTKTSEKWAVAPVSDQALVASLSDKLNKRPRFKTNPNALLEASNQKAEREYQNQMVATVVKRFNEVKGVVQNRNTVK